jgi:hypothetical protein
LNGSDYEGTGSSHKKSARQLLQPLLIKKTVAPNENKNINNSQLMSGYVSASSHNSAIKNTALKTIREEQTPIITKAPPNLQPVILANGV